MKKLIDNLFKALSRVMYAQASHEINVSLMSVPKYQNSDRLNQFEYASFSQHGEDGIIDEIFRRIGLTNQYFVEFGVGDGTENNTANLLFKNWKGLWIEGSASFTKLINENIKRYVSDDNLTIVNSYTTAENIEELFSKSHVPAEFDLLSVDIDGNDFWVWKAIESFNPRVVVVEYNAFWGPSTNWVMPYNAEHAWDYKSVYFGASLKALQVLGEQKGYRLVACDMSGTNAFFVRNDLHSGKFGQECASEFNYEPARFFLQKQYGHKKKYKVFSTLS